MDDDQDLSEIDVVRLFPLAGVVFFPHSVLPLHIFEHRYREMTEDALDGDRLVTIINVRPADEWQGAGPPKLEEYGCVGRILKHERLPDGRFNFLLVGLKRVRLLGEVASEKLYRTARVELVEDDEDGITDGLEEQLLAQFRLYLETFGGIDPDLDEVISSNLPLGVLTDILSHALHLAPTMKQQLLAESLVAKRAGDLVAWLGDAMARAEQPRSTPHEFPPPFSSN